MLKNGQAVETIREFFNASSHGPIAITKSNYYGGADLAKESLETIELLEAVGFKFDKTDAKFKQLKAAKVFTTLGDLGDEATA